MFLSILSYTFLALALALQNNNEALPVNERPATTSQQAANANSNSATTAVESMASKNNCLINSERLEDCQDEVGDSQLPAKVIACLNNCANCVRQWRSGVYNGRSCALDCIQQVENLESLDPDCSLMKYFSSKVVASVVSSS